MKWNGKVKMDWFTKHYTCSKCGSTDLKISKQGGVVCYECNICRREACDPRIVRIIKDKYKDKEYLREIVDELGRVDILSPYLAMMFFASLNYLNGGEGITKNIRKNTSPKDIK